MEVKIDERDLLQVDATIIAGILIFLTVSVVSEPIHASDSVSVFALKFIARYSVMVTLVPFIFAVYVILRGQEPKHGTRLENAKKVSSYGVLLLLASVIVMLFPRLG